MVIVSILSAFAVLRASVYDDTASQEDGLYRQQLLAREAAVGTHEQDVARDLALFGNYEQHVNRARDLRVAARAADLVRAESLRSRAERELVISAALKHDFRVMLPTPSGPGGPTYNPNRAYSSLIHSVFVLHSEIEPAPHRLEARSARADSVGMTWVAALFLLALLLFTLAQIWAANRTVKPTEWRSTPAPGAPVLPEVEPRVLGMAYVLFAGGTAAAVLGLVLGIGIVA